jgi:hypothetical protein
MDLKNLNLVKKNRFLKKKTKHNFFFETKLLQVLYFLSLITHMKRTSSIQFWLSPVTLYHTMFNSVLLVDMISCANSCEQEKRLFTLPNLLRVVCGCVNLSSKGLLFKPPQILKKIHVLELEVYFSSTCVKFALYICFYHFVFAKALFTKIYIVSFLWTPKS